MVEISFKLIFDIKDDEISDKDIDTRCDEIELALKSNENISNVRLERYM